MSELRYNLISKDWVIISNERAKRPSDFKREKAKAAAPKFKQDCPFCPGNEAISGQETARIGDAKAWRVRSIYNKFPALSYKVLEERNSIGPYKRITGFGVHEVIVEHPVHNTCIPLMKDDEVVDVLNMYKERYDAIRKIGNIQAITIFKNHGPAAGCSLEHPHSQLVATPIVPPNLRSRMENAMEYFDVTGECLLCRTLEQELAEKKRMVVATKEFVSFIPYASMAPFLMWVVPRAHKASFSDISSAETADLAVNLKKTLGKLYYGLENPDFNYTIRSVPTHEQWADSFHWHIVIFPRITQPAGFELGSGIFINSSVPEESAEFLRQVKL